MLDVVVQQEETKVTTYTLQVSKQVCQTHGDQFSPWYIFKGCLLHEIHTRTKTNFIQKISKVCEPFPVLVIRAYIIIHTTEKTWDIFFVSKQGSSLEQEQQLYNKNMTNLGSNLSYLGKYFINYMRPESSQW